MSHPPALRPGHVATLLSSSAMALVLLLASGCDCSGPSSMACDTADDCAGSDSCIDGTCQPRADSGDLGTDGGTMDGGARDAGFTCTGDDQCGGGVCIAGSCCTDAANVCGESCCGEGETCFANACVTPGARCRSEQDCNPGQYCEPALGEESSPDAGVPTDAGTGAVCLGAAPTGGRCVDLPPRCEGEPGPGETCLRSCEYHPPVEDLQAVEQWSWEASNAVEFPNSVDVWATPTVGRLTDTNCDGAIDDLDPPAIVFVSGNARGTCCSCGSGNATTCKTGVLRALDGQTGQELWSLRRASDSSMGFSGLSVALGDVDHDGDMEIAVVTGEGYLAIVDHEGQVVAISERPIPNWLNTDDPSTNVHGWGGGLAMADADRDGNPEIAYGRVVFETDGVTVTRQWVGSGSWGTSEGAALSFFVNLDDDLNLELLAGATAYEADGSIKWDRTAASHPDTLPHGFSAIANLNTDPRPEVVYVAAGRIHVLDPETGEDVIAGIAGPRTGPTAAGGPGSGGPPTIADFDGDGLAEIGVAWRSFYQVTQVSADGLSLEQVWATPNHDFSSSVTGSTVFDFEGDGAAEVIYNDECFLWVYDGATGAVRFATQTTSFTATEASLVADVDGDGSAEIVMIANRASPTSWNCDNATWRAPAVEGDADFGRPGWIGSDGASAAYSGITVFRAADNSWVGTRSLWNQHAYSVSNVCGDRGDACVPAGAYGDIPSEQVANWSVDFLNNFRQNVQGDGIFDAPDATVTLVVDCSEPIRMRASVRNLGAALLAPGVEVAFYGIASDGIETELGRATTTVALFPGQVQVLDLDAPVDITPADTTFIARIIIDPETPTFQECRDDNNESAIARARCLD